MSILELLRQGDFAAANDELEKLGKKVVETPEDYSLQSAFADLQACAAYYVSARKQSCET